MANRRKFQKTFRGASTNQADISLQYKEVVKRLEQKYYNLFCSSHLIEGDISDELKRYMYRRFWADGTVCLFNIKHTNLVGGCQYAVAAYDMYSEPAAVDPVYINPDTKQAIPLVPQTTQVVNKDVVIGWYQRNHRPVYELVHSYCSQLADIEMVINTNLNMHKLPYLFNASNPDMANRLASLLQRILNNEVAIGVSTSDINDIQVLTPNIPYIIDKLYTYKCNLENELKTAMGLNNSGVFQKASHTLEAEVESTQKDINDYQDNVDDELTEFSKRIKKVLGKDITFKCREGLAEDNNQVEHMDREEANGNAYRDEH